mgnify:CR=1 FL=1
MYFSLKLLNNFNIKNRLISYHKFNEKKSIKKIIQILNEGKILSLISDAGTPLLSDPGKILLNNCIKNKKQFGNTHKKYYIKLLHRFWSKTHRRYSIGSYVYANIQQHYYYYYLVTY